MNLSRKMVSLRFFSRLLALAGLLVFPSALVAEKTLVATSFYPTYVATLNVCRDLPDLEVVNLAPPFVGCLHDYHLPPAALRTLSRAQVLVVNGGGMEDYLRKVRRQLPRLKVVDASAGISLLENNPHVWVSPTNAATQARNIAEGLAALLPEHAPRLRANGAAYADRLDALALRMRAALPGVAGQQIVTFHEAFPYLAQALDLKVVAVVQREPGSEPNAGELAALVRKLKSTRATAIFTEPQYPSRSAETLSRETGLPVYVLDPAVTGPTDAPAVYDAYLAAMEQNLATLRKALNTPGKPQE